MSYTAPEGVEKEWREVELELARVKPLLKEVGHYVVELLGAVALQHKALYGHYRELQNLYQQLVPVLPLEVWRRVSITARSLGQPLNLVLGDLILRALSSDPNELVRYRLSFCDEMICEGEELLMEGNLVQASEKFWNAIVQILKAVAAKEGLELKTHADLWNYVNRLAKARGDIEIAKLFANANYLHRNFYEGNLLPELVREYIEDAKKLIEKLKRIVEENS